MEMSSGSVSNLDVSLYCNPMVQGPAEEPSVKNARNRFKSVLKHMVQDNFMHEEESDSDAEDNRQHKNKTHSKGGIRRFGISPTSKRRRKSDAVDVPKPQAAFVMKLFDRGLDLAQFDETTPLYPICRAWIQNKPHSARPPRDKPESDVIDFEFTDGCGDVHRLPPPELLPIDEYGNQLTIRIPPPLPKHDDEEEFDINYTDEEAPSPALLFQNHLDRWNLIRLRWKEASFYNERRYGDSFAVLRHMHENRIQPTPSRSDNAS